MNNETRVSHSFFFFYISNFLLHVIFYISGEEYHSSSSLDSVASYFSLPWCAWKQHLGLAGLVWIFFFHMLGTIEVICTFNPHRRQMEEEIIGEAGPIHKAPTRQTSPFNPALLDFLPSPAWGLGNHFHEHLLFSFTK